MAIKASAWVDTQPLANIVCLELVPTMLLKGVEGQNSALLESKK
jgi:hypothetical protein